MNFNTILRANGTLSVRLTTKQGIAWRGGGRVGILYALATMRTSAIKVLVKDERGVIVSLPYGRNDYCRKLPEKISVDLIELDEPYARIMAWKYISASRVQQKRVFDYHQSQPTNWMSSYGAEEVARMASGDQGIQECPLCGEETEVRVEDQIRVLRCRVGH